MIEHDPRWDAVYAARPRRGGKATEQRQAAAEQGVQPSARHQVAEVAEAEPDPHQ